MTQRAGAIPEDRRIARSRTAIVSGATEAFLASGYDGTSIDDVAAAAGVARRTVYNVYGDKEALFRVVLLQATEIAESYAERLADASTDLDGGGIEAVFIAMARDLADSIVGGPVIAVRRLLISEVRRFPELAADYYDRAPGLVMRTLAATIARFHAAGVLHAPDAERAGEHFAFLTIGASLDRGLFDVEPSSGAAALAHERAESGARAFLRAYAPRRSEQDG